MAFDATDFKIFHIPAYMFMAIIGLAVAICVFIMLVYEKGYSLPKNMRSLLLAAVSTLLFAKLFGIISYIIYCITEKQEITADVIKNSGIVFYGGLFGLLIAYMIIPKITKEDRHIIDIVAVTVPLFHFFARIGCFLGGCCFGIEHESLFSVHYTTNIPSGLDTSLRIPVQLIEALFNVGIFIYLLTLIKKDNWKEKNILNRYLLIYSIGRFILEFLRGDIIRGVIDKISFSQIICFCIWIYLLISLLKKKKHREGMRA